MNRRLGAPLRDVSASYGQRTALSEADHRPWPVPERRWFMGQSWFDLLFAHWRVEPRQLERVVPPQLPLDLIDGSAWIAITPFQVRALRLRLTLPLPFLSVFPELNVRTYVSVDGKPGIYFLSLDAGSAFAVAAARRTYRFPYFRARMSIERRDGSIAYRSARRDPTGPPAELRSEYRPLGRTFNARSESIEASLIERYCAYTLDEDGVVQRAQIHHRPWELQRVRAEFATNTMAEPFGIRLDGEPMLHFAPRQDVVIWPLEPVSS